MQCNKRANFNKWQQRLLVQHHNCTLHTATAVAVHSHASCWLHSTTSRALVVDSMLWTRSTHSCIMSHQLGTHLQNFGSAARFRACTTVTVTHLCELTLSQQQTTIDETFSKTRDKVQLMQLWRKRQPAGHVQKRFLAYGAVHECPDQFSSSPTSHVQPPGRSNLTLEVVRRSTNRVGAPAASCTRSAHTTLEWSSGR